MKNTTFEVEETKAYNRDDSYTLVYRISVVRTSRTAVERIEIPVDFRSKDGAEAIAAAMQQEVRVAR